MASGTNVGRLFSRSSTRRKEWIFFFFFPDTLTGLLSGARTGHATSYAHALGEMDGVGGVYRPALASCMLIHVGCSLAAATVSSARGRGEGRNGVYFIFYVE